MRRVRICWLAAVLAGCSAAPQNHYYVLTPGPGEGVAISPELARPDVTVQLPALLDRAEIVEGSGAQAVRIHDVDRWAAPLDEMVPRILAEDLARHEAAASPSGFQRVDVRIDEFMCGEDGVVRLAGTWTKAAGDDRQAGSRTWQFALRTRTRSAQMSAAAAAMSELLDRLAGAIAAATDEWPR